MGVELTRITYSTIDLKSDVGHPRRGVLTRHQSTTIMVPCGMRASQATPRHPHGWSAADAHALIAATPEDEALAVVWGAGQGYRGRRRGWDGERWQRVRGGGSLGFSED